MLLERGRLMRSLLQWIRGIAFGHDGPTGVSISNHVLYRAGTLGHESGVRIAAPPPAVSGINWCFRGGSAVVYIHSCFGWIGWVKSVPWQRRSTCRGMLALDVESPDSVPVRYVITYSTNHVYLHRFSRLRFCVCV